MGVCAFRPAMLLRPSPRNAACCSVVPHTQVHISLHGGQNSQLSSQIVRRRHLAVKAAACDAQAAEAVDQPPTLATHEHVEDWHDQKRRDEYHWLSKLGPTHPEVLSYLKAESHYTLSKLAHTRQLQLDLQDNLQDWSNARVATDRSQQQQQQQQQQQCTDHQTPVHPDWLGAHGQLQYKQCKSFGWPGTSIGQYRFFSVLASSSPTALVHCRAATAAAAAAAAAVAAKDTALGHCGDTDADYVTGDALPASSVIIWDESGSSSSSSTAAGSSAWPHSSSSSSVHSIAVSPCGSYVAVTYSRNNGRTYDLAVINSSTGAVLLQPVRDVDGPVLWITPAVQPLPAAAAAASCTAQSATAQHQEQQQQQQCRQYLIYVTNDFREVQCLSVSSSSNTTIAAAAAAAVNQVPAAAPSLIFRDPQHVSVSISALGGNTFITVFGADGLIRQVLYYSSSSSSSSSGGGGGGDSSSSSCCCSSCQAYCTPDKADAWHVLLPAAAVADSLKQRSTLNHNLQTGSATTDLDDNMAAAAAAAIRAAGDDDPSVRLGVSVIDKFVFVRRSCATIPQGQLLVTQMSAGQQQQQQQQQQMLHWQQLLPAQDDFYLEAAFVSPADLRYDSTSSSSSSSSSNSDPHDSSGKSLQLLVLGWRHHEWQQQQQQQRQAPTAQHTKSTVATCRRLEVQLYSLQLQSCCCQHQQQQEEVMISSLQQQCAFQIPMPDAVYELHSAVWYTGQQELHIEFSSLVRPRSKLTLNLQQQQQWRRQHLTASGHISNVPAAAAAAGYCLELSQAVPDSFDQSQYDTVQIGVPALCGDDDALIPLSLAYNKQAVQLPSSILAHHHHHHNQQQQQQQGHEHIAPLDSSTPTTPAAPAAPAAVTQRKVLLTCYGSYAICESVFFQPELLLLLDAGWVVAVAHVRGGGWLGRSWAEAGRGLAKSNSVTDLLSVAKYIHQSGLCDPQGLFVQGSSAGGWLAAAAALLQPQLFAAAVLTVPCLDPLGLLLHQQQGQLELGQAATEREVYDSIRAWAPYDLLEQMLYPEQQHQQQQSAVVTQAATTSTLWWQQQQHGVRLPHLLIRAALNDEEVPISNVVKATARLRRLADILKAQQQQQQQQLEGDLGLDHALPFSAVDGPMHPIEATGSSSISTVKASMHSCKIEAMQVKHHASTQHQLLLRVIPGGHLAYKGSVRESALKLAFLMAVVH